MKADPKGSKNYKGRDVSLMRKIEMHSFNVELATKIGLNSAIVYRSIECLTHGEEEKACSRQTLIELIPYIGEKQIDYCIKKLLKIGFLSKVTKKVNKTVVEMLFFSANAQRNAKNFFCENKTAFFDAKKMHQKKVFGNCAEKAEKEESLNAYTYQDSIISKSSNLEDKSLGLEDTSNLNVETSNLVALARHKDIYTIYSTTKEKENKTKERETLPTKPLQSEDETATPKKATPPYREIVDYLNAKAGKRFSSASQPCRESINARFAEGRTLEDFKIVIDKKCDEWLNTNMEKYLRPSTLFRPTNFENYLNQPTTMVITATEETDLQRRRRELEEIRARAEGV